MPGGGARPPRPQATTRGRPQHRQASASLPLDIVLEIAACSDPVTLVRCAATCWEARRRITEDAAFRGRLRLRHSDRFVLPLLRGHFVETRGYLYDIRREKSEWYFLDTAGAADDTEVRQVPAGLSSAPLASRDGLLLLRDGTELRVCEPDTGRTQILPSMPTFPGTMERLQYVFLDGGGTAGELGRPFQLLVTMLDIKPFRRHLQIQTFSSEHNTWGPSTEIRIPNLYGSCLEEPIDYCNRGVMQPPGGHVIIGGAVHWLCVTNARSYVIKLHVRSAHVTVTELPKSFHPGNSYWTHRYLLAAATTSSGGRSLIVLVADGEKVCVWSQSKQNAKWKQQPQPVIDAEKLVRFAQDVGGLSVPRGPVLLHWFAERSGIVLIQISYHAFFWLDLRTMEVVRCFSPHRLQPVRRETVCCPCEIGLSSWFPKFSSTLH